MKDNKYNLGKIDLGEILSVLLLNKYKIAIASIFTSLLFLSISFFIPNQYKSFALLAPAQSNELLSSQLGSYSSLAGIAGISMPSNPEDRSVEAIERIKSFEFFSRHFLPYINLEDLMAIKKWQRKENKIIYKKKLYNANQDEWVRDVKPPKTPKPSDQEAYKVYKKLLSINQDAQTKFVLISIKHKSPHISKDWLDLIILNVNESMRNEDKEIAKASIDFLNNRSINVNINELKEAISQLLESEMKKLMFASVNKSYIFRILDHPISPEEHATPIRLLFLFLGLIFGFLVSSYHFILKEMKHLNSNE